MVNCHSHTTHSIFDSVGYPKDHIDYIIESGGDGMAITEHGNMNSFADAFLYAEKLSRKGVKFKYVPGIEAYFIASLTDWQEAYEQNKELKKKKKDIVIASELTYEIDEDQQQSISDIIKHRNHLTLLAKNQTGIESLFRLTTLSYKNGFYNYPRMDFDMLKAHAKDVICLSGCVSGIFASTIYKLQKQNKSFDEIQNDLLNITDRFVDIFKDNFFYEIQFNKLEQQHVLNKHLVALHKKTNIKLVATNDSHYYHPNTWKERELYRKLSPKFSSFSDTKDLPKCVSELECELYPKNGDETFEAYKKYCSDKNYITDDKVIEAIENSWYLVHDHIGNITVDKTIKLPSFKHTTKSEFTQLAELCIQKLRDKNLHKNNIYVDRLKYELTLIKEKEFERYFLTLHKTMSEITKELMCGPARGSGSGSLVNYLLDIIQVDPIRFDLSIARFITRARCLDENLFSITDTGIKQLKDICIGDKILTNTGKYKSVLDKIIRKEKRVIRISHGNNTFICSLNHKWLVKRNNKIIKIKASEIEKSDFLILKNNKHIIEQDTLLYENNSYIAIDIIDIIDLDNEITLIDFEVKDDHTFYISSNKQDYILTHNSSMPDVDLDFEDKEKATKILQRVFGKDNVLRISNYNTLQLKSLIKDISKFYDIPFQEVNSVTRVIENEVRKKVLKKGDDKNLFKLTLEDTEKYSETFKRFIAKYPYIKTHIDVLYENIRSISTHAGGMLIADTFDGKMPVIISKGKLQSPIVEGVKDKYLEAFGFLKFDFLALLTLRIIRACIEKVLENKGQSTKFENVKDFYNMHLHPDNADLNDQKVFKNVWWKANYPGVFQFSSCLSGNTCITMFDGTQKRIDEIKIGDLVKNYNIEKEKFEIEEVNNFYKRGIKDCIEIELENNVIITCTPDHKFLTKNRGWVEAQALTESDDLVENV